ncbi:tRNA uridine 5-carboxymethylaminomethyl modification enzyme MnmG [Candidatus Tremblaya princeps]|uniref:tRNA uridine 5-carboxymethylaminomethyl modification enzyme MnmG n=1 Tax=Tremblaya princeps TaxID=189385 RepID=A0A143WP75_TREPR|nr:tRNA uridine 5-carboxymethylaminomethyl modification enzyme MnmG [Candidatus Tremblaya princeps]
MMFKQRLHHAVLVDPMGQSCEELYLNGLSTSMDLDMLDSIVGCIAGLVAARITSAGHAVEYYFDPMLLRPSIESRVMDGVDLAEKVNVTTGYQEAAANWLVTCVNAARHSAKLSAWAPHRHASYRGVLIDSIVRLGVSEPYRMFTSRGDDRTAVREDNADRRLTRTGRELGIVPDHRLLAFGRKEMTISSLHHCVMASSAHPAGCRRSDAEVVSGEQFYRINHASPPCLDAMRRMEGKPPRRSIRLVLTSAPHEA